MVHNQQTGLPNYIKTAIQEEPKRAAEIVLDAYTDKSELDQPEIILSVLTFIPEEFVDAFLKDERIAPVVCSENSSKVSCSTKVPHLTWWGRLHERLAKRDVYRVYEYASSGCTGWFS